MGKKRRIAKSKKFSRKFASHPVATKTKQGELEKQKVEEMSNRRKWLEEQAALKKKKEEETAAKKAKPKKAKTSTSKKSKASAE